MATAAGSMPRFVTTIDFGTTHCSVAYLLRPDLEPILSEVDPTVLILDNAGNRRVPSCILFDSNGTKMAFGHEARERYAAQKRELKPQYHYFEHVKKHLQHEKGRSQSITSEIQRLRRENEELKEQKESLLLNAQRDRSLQQSEFDWVTEECKRAKEQLVAYKQVIEKQQLQIERLACGQNVDTRMLSYHLPS